MVRPVVRYWIWALVALKLLLPVTLSTPASLAYWLVPASHGESTPAAPIMGAPRFEVATAQANTTQEIRDARPESDPLPAVPVRPEVPIATAQAIPTPVVQNNRLLISGLMFELNAAAPTAKVLWPDTMAPSKRLLSNTSSPLLQGDYVYSAKSSGELVCLEAGTGKRPVILP